MSFKTITAHEVDALLEQPNSVVLDMRDSRSYAEAHIKGAIPASEPNVMSLVNRRDEDPTIVVYCYHGVSSRQLADFLAGLGFSNVYSLEGGWASWSLIHLGR